MIFFQDPQPLDPWEGIKDAVKDAGPSVGIDIMNPNLIIGTEDCLYLNIFTPKVSGLSVVSFKTCLTILSLIYPPTALISNNL